MVQLLCGTLRSWREISRLPGPRAAQGGTFICLHAAGEGSERAVPGRDREGDGRGRVRSGPVPRELHIDKMYLHSLTSGDARQGCDDVAHGGGSFAPEYACAVAVLLAIAGCRPDLPAPSALGDARTVAEPSAAAPPEAQELRACPERDSSQRDGAFRGGQRPAALGGQWIAPRRRPAGRRRHPARDAAGEPPISRLLRRRGSALSPSLTGEVEITFRIGLDGHVAGVQVGKARLLSQEVIRCLVREYEIRWSSPGPGAS